LEQLQQSPFNLDKNTNIFFKNNQLMKKKGGGGGGGGGVILGQPKISPKSNFF
jgi:hypothetical protein